VCRKWGYRIYPPLPAVKSTRRAAQTSALALHEPLAGGCFKRFKPPSAD
jgi:hypothetical protein